MTCPFFTPATIPVPSFAELLRRARPSIPPSCPSDRRGSRVPHATTCVAIRYADGVVMAGDRRATAGNLISHRTMEKVFPADRHTGVAIAGAAGPAMEMVKLFQLQLEHYEKVEGAPLSLEGKANQLSMMVRGNLPAAMQGLVVVPLFAGYDTAPRRRAGCSSTTSPAAATRSATTSPPARAACTPAPSSSSATATGIDRDDAVDLVIQALWEAADEDSATGGPDLVRGIYPIVATITADGLRPGRRRRARRALPPCRGGRPAESTPPSRPTRRRRRERGA